MNFLATQIEIPWISSVNKSADLKTVWLQEYREAGFAIQKNGWKGFKVITMC